ncbi:hypothetical protein M569_15152, partial [Genlisea aurea]
QVAIHAIGDRANDMILDMYKSVAFENGMRDRRFRIEHAQHLSHGAAARFGRQKVVASVQPDHMLDAADLARKLGLDRVLKGSYLFRSILAGDGDLILGSDWPVADIDPLRSMITARRRVPRGQEAPWNPSESITLQDALNGYTVSAARGCFLDADVGSLSVGKMADFVVLSVDSWEEYEEEGQVSVEATYVGGLEAYN